MKIKKVEWKNFASYGNRKQEIEFGETSHLYQIIGDNGAGKSTISQVITFCLYGKIEGKKLKDIPNRINGNTWTRVTLDHFGTEVIVERGLDPSFFRIFIDGVEYDQAGIKNVQDYLVDNILGIPYYVFNNTILLSINDFKSFIKMSPQDKRAIIDKIFGFHILNQMREVLKAEIKKLKESSDFLGGKINSLEMSLNSSLKEMEQLTTKIEEQSQNKIQELEKTLSTFEELQRVHGDKVLDLKEKEETLKNRLYSTNQSLFDSRSKVKELIRKLGLYESDKCPTCESSLNTEFHQSMKEELQIEKQKLEKSITEADNEYQKMITLKDSLDVNKNEILEKGMKIRARIESILKEIGDLKKEDVNLQTQSLQRILQTLENDKNTLTVEKYQKEEKQSWFKSLDEILSERGVKQMAIRTILPSLNSEIVELLKKMNLGYQVIFDEEFSANIYHMGMEISSQTLSTGEMKKIDFVVLISIMKLMKMKFSNINLLFLDELFSSVDQEGVYQITSILKDSSRELGLNIFVINHAPMPHEIFDYKIEITKANNFSSILLDRF
jgi:DNA repair exonuclease SbcCD ATPase subunit